MDNMREELKVERSKLSPRGRGRAVVRCDVGTDMRYVAELVRTLRGH